MFTTLQALKQNTYFINKTSFEAYWQYTLLIDVWTSVVSSIKYLHE